MRFPKAAAAVLVLGLVLGVGAPASAAGGPPPGFDPSGSKWREYMLTITGRVLGKAMPDKWRAEMIANEYALRYSPDALAAATGIGRGGSLNGVPGTIEDYTMQAYERQHRAGVVAKKSPAIPATGFKNLAKGAAGVGGTVLGLQMGFGFGSGVSQLFGLDSAGAVCSSTPDNGAILTQFFTGVDCDAWKLNSSYVVNSDTETSFSVAGYSVSVVRKVFPNPGDAYKKFSLYTCSPGARLSSGEIQVHLKSPSGNLVPWSSVGFTASGSENCGFSGPGYAGWAYSPDGFYTLVEVRYYDGKTYTDATQIKGDPERTLDCTLRYTDGSSDVATSDPYRESSGSVSALRCPSPAPGKVVSSVGVSERGSGESNTLYDAQTTDEYRDYTTRFGDCADQLCLLDLVTKKTPGSVVSCFDLQQGCEGWWEDPAKASNYECVYGSQVVDLDECAVYAGLFTPGRVEVGAPYSDPMTGTWSGSTSAPKPDQQAMGQSLQDPAATWRSCTGMAVTGFDPVGFVMRPVQCALEWAFVPRPAKVDLLSKQTELDFKKSLPGKLATSVASVGATFDDLGGGNCRGIVVPYAEPGPDGQPVSRNTSFMAACGGDFLAPYAPYVFWGFTAIIAITGIFAVKSQADKFVGNT